MQKNSNDLYANTNRCRQCVRAISGCRNISSVAADTGSLNIDEFMRLVGSIGLKSEPEMEQEFEDALRFFDKDGRGLINAQQLKSALQCYGEPLDNEDLNELIRMADAKGDGKIDYLGKTTLVIVLKFVIKMWT